jgi:hypothetical protein
MKEIKTDSFKKMADQNVYPPIDEEEDGSKMTPVKGWKYLPQLNKWVRDVEVDIAV